MDWLHKNMGNTFKTAFLLTALTLLLMFFGRYFGGQNGMFLALAFAAVMNFVSYFYSDKIALAMYRAKPVTREELPRAFAAVERLTQKIGIPMPKMYVIPTESPNAFATGRNPSHASVAVTHGILQLLNRTYQFLAPRFMPVTEWINNSRPVRKAKKERQMVW